MIEVISQTEDAPAIYPVPPGLSQHVEPADIPAHWRRIEQYISWRFFARRVVWRVAGHAGDVFNFPLYPARLMLDEPIQFYGSEVRDFYSVKLGPFDGVAFHDDGEMIIPAIVGEPMMTVPEHVLDTLVDPDANISVAERASVGDALSHVPEDVLLAFKRLAEYSADCGHQGRAGASRYSLSLGGDYQQTYERYPTWRARALQLSGAADLLRGYRKLTARAPGGPRFTGGA